MTNAIGILKPPQPPAAETSAARLKRVCIEFETLFINRLLESQGAGAGGDSFLGSNHVVRSMFNQNVAQRLADGGGIGIADMLFDRLQDR